jgi:hypothetical protein
MCCCKCCVRIYSAQYARYAVQNCEMSHKCELSLNVDLHSYSPLLPSNKLIHLYHTSLNPFLGLFSLWILPIIQQSKEHDISETRSVPVFR